jgi:acetoin utilization protein AcuB
MASEEWITTREAAARLGVTTARVRQLLAEGALEAQKVGGKYRGQWLVSARAVEKRRQQGVDSTMKVKKRMTPSPVTATPRMNYNDALRLMRENDIAHLPIVRDGRLVGIVTKSDMLRAEPSRVTSLSVFEIASLLESVTMEQIMSRPVYAVDEECSISNAARFMLDHDIGSLPVVREGQVVGIITDTDIFETFVEITGGGQSGSRIEVRMPDQKGELVRLLRVFAEAGSYVVSVAVSYDDTGDYYFADIKERGGDEEAMRRGMDELGNAELVEFRPSDQDRLLTFQ